MLKITEEKLLVFSSAIIISFLIFSFSLFLVLIDKGVYNKNFEESGAYEKIGVEGVRVTIDYLIKYLIGDQNDPRKVTGLYAFTPSEQSHLQDVHAIFKKIKYSSLIAIAALVIIFLRLRAKDNLNKNIKRILKYSSIKAAALLVLTVFFSLNFDWAFTQFHHIFFPQGNWQFAADSLLIILFPQTFFKEFMQKILFHVLLISMILYFLGTTSNLTELFHWKKKDKL